MRPAFEVISTGSGLSIQDRGRPGFMRFGIPIAGALDTDSASIANTLVGNRSDSPVLECFRQGVILRALDTVRVGVAGAASCEHIPVWTSKIVKKGTRLAFGKGSKHNYCYFAVAGGFSARSHFGSVSVDRRAGLGEAIKKGTVLSRKHPVSAEDRRIGKRYLADESLPNLNCKRPFKLLPGPQFAQFSDEEKSQIVGQIWEITKHGDRTGIRIQGDDLLPKSFHIDSQPVLPGSIQLPEGGQPIVLLNDGPTTGGYPVPATLDTTDRYRFVQMVAGTKVKFVWK